MIEHNLIALKQNIAACEKKYHRAANSVQLLLASKDQPTEKIITAYQCGEKRFGENYLQEALLKINALQHLSIEWHFIGPIQSNKTKKIAEHFAWVQSVDDLRIAKRLNDQRPDHLPPLNICIEVNVSAEKNKSGILLEAVETFAKQCQSFSRLKLRGLMTIPALQTDFAAQCAAFKSLQHIFVQLNQQEFALDTLSMGMTQDYEAAIASGATMIRIGTAVFGDRTSL